MRNIRVLGVCFCALLVACSTETPPVDEPENTDQQESSVAAVQEPRETQNVSYSGTVKPEGISIYQQGSHRLVFSDGRFILLESDSVDLNGYVNEDVEVFGAVRPTVEEGAMIMRVENIRLLTPVQEEPDTHSGSVASASGSVAQEPEKPVEQPTSSQEPERIPEQPASSAKSAEQTNSSASSAESDEESEEVVLTASQESAVESMAADTYSADRWTQQYCTGHIGFCVPAHKNWWFKSFGTTSSNLWHVEMSIAPVENLGDGVIYVNLVSGSLAETGVSDGTVRVEGDVLVGYKSWEDDTHFEIISDARLRAPVEYMIQNLATFSEE